MDPCFQAQGTNPSWLGAETCRLFLGPLLESNFHGEERIAVSFWRLTEKVNNAFFSCSFPPFQLTAGNSCESSTGVRQGVSLSPVSCTGMPAWSLGQTAVATLAPTDFSLILLASCSVPLNLKLFRMKKSWAEVFNDRSVLLSHKCSCPS